MDYILNFIGNNEGEAWTGYFLRFNMAFAKSSTDNCVPSQSKDELPSTVKLISSPSFCELPLVHSFSMSKPP